MTHEHKNTNDSQIYHKQKGAVYLVLLLVMSGVFIFLATAIMGLAFANLKLARHNEAMVSSLNVAEAGANYYLWHLLHNKNDYCDGQTGSQCTLGGDGYFGPYTHYFKDADLNILGEYEISIKPPVSTGALATVKSVGKAKNTNFTRTVVADIGIPSFAAYALLSDDIIWLGTNEATDGPVHSNIGIRYDPLNANDTISSSRKTYIPPSSSGGNGTTTRNGVWSPLGSGIPWDFPTPRVDFAAIAASLGKIRLYADTDPNGGHGIFLPSSGKKGYHLTLKVENGISKIDVTTVTSETVNGIVEDLNTKITKDAPANGIFYVNDYVWIDGEWNSTITIATPMSRVVGSNSFYLDQVQPSITIINNLKYSVRNGTAKIGLITTGDISVPPYATSTMEIDAAMASQTGHVWYPQVSKIADNRIKEKITIYGSISSYLYWNWTWIYNPKIVVAEAGDASYNGVYTQSGTCNGKTQYIYNGNRYLFQAQDMNGTWIWRLHTACQNNSVATDISTYYGGNSNADPLQTNPWSTGSGGTAPAPTIADVTGFKNTMQNFDPSLKNSQPPYFPASDSYQILSWREE